MPHKPKFAALALALGCLAQPVFGSNAPDEPAGRRGVVKVWGADEGLLEASVTDVAQTPEGYMWVGTLFGSVLRFDGTRFIRYNSANTPAFSLKWGIPHFMVDRGGTLWISMVDGGMTTWDKKGFHSVFLTSTNQPERMLWSAPGRVIFVYADGKLLSGHKQGEEWDWETVTPLGVAAQGQHCADADGSVWYLRADNELGVWDGRQTKTIALDSPLLGQRLKVLSADAQGRIWIGTESDLAQWQTNHFEVMTPTNGEAVLNVKRIVPSGGSNLWVEAGGRMRRCAGRRWIAEAEGWNRELGKRPALRFLHGDSNGGLWTSVGDLGLIHVMPNGAIYRLTTRDGLPSNTIHFAFQDSDGDTWTGYERGGLVQVRQRLFQEIGKDEGLADSLVNTVCEDAQGRVWIGTHSGIVGVVENGSCSNITLAGPSRTQDSCVAADALGHVWIGAQGAGLWKWESGRLEQIATETQLQGYPRLLVAARDGSLWLGTIWSIIHVDNGKLDIDYTAQDVGGHTTALAEAADGSIWAGTLDGFLMHWDGKRFIPLEPPQRSSLGRIWALWPTPDGGLWAGTEQGGLLHWHNGQFRRYTTKDGLPSDSVIQVLVDTTGNLWLGTRAGIARVFGAALGRYERNEVSRLGVSVFGKPDGLLTIGSAIIDQPNCWRGHDGTLFFAMANSVAYVKPEIVHVNPVPPSVALEELRADDKQVWPERVGAVLTASGSERTANRTGPVEAIKIGPGHGDLEFHYTGLSLGSPLRVRFKYKLEGLENAWNDASAERKAGYRHVPPGQYVFHVMACNSDDIWSEDDALLAVTVQPHFYQGAWFQVGGGSLAAGGVFVAVVAAMRRRIHLRLEKLERQHALERERARIARDLHDELGAGLTEIGLLGALLQDPSRFSTRKHEALGRIVQRCRDLVMSLDEIVWAVNPRNDSLNSLASYLCRYAQSFLEPTSICCRLELHEAEPDGPFESEERHNLFLAFKEALTNVVRHSQATEVRIKIDLSDKGLLSIGIEDNGCGLSPTAAPDADGLDNLRRRMSQIGGRCDIASRPGGGVAVDLKLPLN